MHRTKAVIRKVGNKFCVFSENGKNLGCSKTRPGAEKRLQQVEFFKNKGSADMNYKDAFNNLGKALSQGFTPEELGRVPDGQPRHIEVPSETLSVVDSLKEGTIACRFSSRLLDKKDHFPVVSQTQAQSSMARVMMLTDAPVWYAGSLGELRKEVFTGINNLHPGIVLNVRVPAELAVGLSDGEIPAETSKTSVQDPEDDRKVDLVPQVARPTLTSAQVEIALADEETRKAVAGRLMEMIDKQIDNMKSAKKVGERLLKSGLKSEEFDQLSTYLQEDILHELMARGVTGNTRASEDRRRELLDRMKNNG